ncbi:MAG TPA: hypothetical protein DCG42_13030 [Maribacter sp.]|uniref:hypothetical protein n=1 Tax=unclassified Maribacter TaxID=2615042 RepID=UPI000EC1AA40|nr:MULTISPECIES: hypothetical protein [unclassified Maribacter]HAF78231.1 hypothetical protein [Maribacter sp.]HAI43897.1 hypothetical protein [Maribacter sp.]|tara:strand:- start:494 stop:826 length:333 start_codon:yes stop_codon:yes gene_type:complete
MITAILTLCFTGFYLGYATTKRQKVPVHLHIENWCQKKSKVANSLGYVLLLFACSLTIYHFGWGSGIFTFSVILMTIASLVILLQPLHLITYKTLIPTVLLIFLIEFSLL